MAAINRKLKRNASSYKKRKKVISPTAVPYQHSTSISDNAEAHYNLGNVLRTQGRLSEAVASYQCALNLKPDYTEAWHNLGILLYTLGKLEDAETSFHRVLSLNKDFAGAHNNLGIVFQAQGRLREAAVSYNRVLFLQPNCAEAHNNLGNTLHDLGKHAEAEVSYRKALSLRPDYVEAHTNLGIELQTKGRLEEAADSYRRALALKPNHIDALNNLGTVLKDQGRLEEAIVSYRRALALRPDFTEVYYNLGMAFNEQGNLEEAIANYRQALSLKPDYAEAHNNLGVALIDLGKIEEALASYRQAIALQPDYANAYNNLGIALNAQGEIYEAEASYHRALTLQPDYAEVYYNLGILYSELGNKEKAKTCFRKALSLKPDYAKVYKGLSTITKFSSGDDMIRSMENLYNNIEISDADRIDLGFVLGKVFGDLKNYDKAFSYILNANLLKRGTFEYSAQSERNFFEKIRLTFSPNFFASHHNTGNQDKTPIFIVGMPRSGTTLVEQILASHSLVYGAGELVVLEKLTRRVCSGETTAPFPECMMDLDDDALERMGKAYIEKIRKYSKDARYITDKMPGNFLRIGVIKTILPYAKVIHCVRNPMDTCFSIFKNDFAEINGYAYKMEELGHYYNLYRDLMAHWEKVLPGFIYNLRYEKMVADQQEQTKKLLAFCGLPWDDACLTFHRTERKVNTASLAQVRQPIYRDSVELWKHYEKQLEPLRKAINI